MTTRKQLEANRRNAKRSTGPKSAFGKARSSKNALNHGLTARDILIGDEDPDQFDALRAELEINFGPQTAAERELLDDLVWSFWRRRRVRTVEAAFIRAHQENVAWQECVYRLSQVTEWRLDEAIKAEGKVVEAMPEETHRARWFEFLTDVIKEEVENPGSVIKDYPWDHFSRGAQKNLAGLLGKNDGKLDTLLRYETRIMNDIARTLDLLNQIQAQRRAAERDMRVIEGVALPPPRRSKS